jgi:hypothetical protein
MTCAFALIIVKHVKFQARMVNGVVASGSNAENRVGAWCAKNVPSNVKAGFNVTYATSLFVYIANLNANAANRSAVRVLASTRVCVSLVQSIMSAVWVATSCATSVTRPSFRADCAKKV